MRYLLVLSAALWFGFGVLVSSAEAAWFGKSFSADIVMSNPQDPSSVARGKLYVGEGRIRGDGEFKGDSRGVIVIPGERKLWTVLSGKKQYYEGMGDAPPPPMPDEQAMPGEAGSPCQSQAVTCTKLGEEQVNGRQTEKWQVVISDRGQSQYIWLWMDPSIKVVIHQQYKDGPTMNRVFRGMETVNGRHAEKWELITTFKGKTQRSFQWVDRSLKATVRSTGGDGKFSFDLTNIQEGPQPDSLFQIPAGFTQIEAPKRQEQQPQQQRGQPQPQYR